MKYTEETKKLLHSKECRGDSVLCRKCGNYKHITKFYKARKGTNEYRYGLSSQCKKCYKIYIDKKKSLESGNSDLKKILKARMRSIKERCLKKGWDMYYDYTYLQELWKKQEGKCAISGLPMTSYLYIGRCPTNVGVDRIDSSLPYTKDNSQLICDSINRMKSDMPTEDILYFCKHIYLNNK